MTVDPSNLRILNYPHPALRRRAKPVESITDEVKAVAERMLELMHEAPGVGLAAPQVGLSWRLFVANSGEEGDVDRVYINPALSQPEGPLESLEEGCLSLPDIRGEVRRPVAITIEATDLNGDRFEMRDDGLLARVWQHEFDHLDGTLIFDRFSQLTKLATRRQIRDLERLAAAR
ncbi:MAG: peptide deformylase [Phycisphaerales bacterium]